MTERATDPYLLTPVGRPNRQARFVLGPRLGPSYSELVRQLEQARERLDNEAALRLKYQHQLSQCARVFAVLSHLYPELRGLIARARKDIWHA